MSTGGNAEGYGAPTPQGSFIGKASHPEKNGRALTHTVQTVRAVVFVSAMKKLLNFYSI
jgi:hypothetical protein